MLPWITYDGSPAIVSIGPAARGVVAIGVASFGLVAFGGALSVGVISIGTNAVGGVALGVNAVGAVAGGLANALGAMAFALVNGIGSMSRAGVNELAWPPMGFLVAALALGLSMLTPVLRPPRPETPSLSSLPRARTHGGWVRVLVEWAESGKLAVSGHHALDAEPHVVEAAAARLRGQTGYPTLLLRIAVADEPIPGAAAGYRDAPPSQRVARVVELADAPPHGWLPADKAELTWMLGTGARATAVASAAIAIASLAT